MNARSLRIFAAGLAIVMSIAGCGYHQGGGSSDNPDSGKGTGYHWTSIYRPDVNTISVPIFKNNDYQRGVEFALTKSLVNQIEAVTPYKVVPRERADTILEGEIVQIRVNTLSKDTKSAVPTEQLLDMTVNFTWKDLHTGRILVQRRGMEQTASYYPTLGEGEWVGTQAATESMALQIVHELQADW